LNGHNFLNLDPKIFFLVPENREFISLQENIKKILILMMPKYSKNFRLGPLKNIRLFKFKNKSINQCL
jgi:hypothetical protein